MLVTPAYKFLQKIPVWHKFIKNAKRMFRYYIQLLVWSTDPSKDVIGIGIGVRRSEPAACSPYNTLGEPCP